MNFRKIYAFVPLIILKIVKRMPYLECKGTSLANDLNIISINFNMQTIKEKKA